MQPIPESPVGLNSLREPLAHFADAADWLRHEFVERIKKNQRYSLRSFARRLNLNPGALSEMLSKKRKISLRSGLRISEALGLAQPIREEFLALIKGAKFSGDTARTLEDTPRENLKLSMDRYNLVAEWYHYAILSLLEIENRNIDPEKTAARLGISPAKVNEAIERLMRLKLISRLDNNKYSLCYRSVNTPDGVASSAIKQAHRDCIAKSLEALNEVPVENRDITSITMAIDPDKLPQAKRMLSRFRRRLSALLETGNRRSIYLLNLQLIPTSPAEVLRDAK